MAPPSPVLAVPNVTAHPSTVSVPNSYYLTLPLDSKGLKQSAMMTITTMVRQRCNKIATTAAARVNQSDNDSTAAWHINQLTDNVKS